MRYLLLAMLLAGALTGCSRGGGEGGGARMISAPKPDAFVAKEIVSPAARYLAYSHSLTIDAPDDKIAAVADAGRAACAAAAADLCAVLESEIRTGNEASARLKFRARPAGIQKLRAALSAQGEVTEQSTSAEDLEGPILDQEKSLAMLKAYRSKLEGLAVRADTNVDALIKLNHELAEVQSQLESATGTHAHLMQQVQTELLNVTIEAATRRSFSKPVTRAFAEFGSHLAEGIAMTITGVAFLLPWVLVLALFTWIGRKLMRRIRRAKAAPAA